MALLNALIRLAMMTGVTEQLCPWSAHSVSAANPSAQLIWHEMETAVSFLPLVHFENGYRFCFTLPPVD